MANKRNIEIQDHEGNIYNPHTAAKVVFLEDGKNVESQLAQMATDIGGKAASNHNHDTKYLGKTAKAESSKSADSVPWSGVGGKPSTFTPSSHTHDDRYYTETEMKEKLKWFNGGMACLGVSNQNLNNYETNARLMGENMINAPTTGWYFVDVFGHNSLYTRQVAYDFNGKKIYTRIQAGGNWSEWFLISTVNKYSTSAPTGTNWDVWYQHE